MHEFLAFRAAGGDEQQKQWKRQRFDLDSHHGRGGRPAARLSHLPRLREDNVPRGFQAGGVLRLSGGMARRACGTDRRGIRSCSCFLDDSGERVQGERLAQRIDQRLQARGFRQIARAKRAIEIDEQTRRHVGAGGHGAGRAQLQGFAGSCGRAR